MLDSNSNIQDLQSWLSNKCYLSESTHPLDCEHHTGIVINGILSAREESELNSAALEPPFGSIVFKYGMRSFVSACPVGKKKLAFKYYHRLSLRRQLGYTLWGSRCMRAWVAARVFRAIGIQTPQPIAIFENKRLGILQDTSILVTHISEGVPLPQFLEKWAHDPDKMKQLATNCLQIFEQFAKYRIYHRDTAPKNFIVAPDCSVAIIDLDAVQLAMPLEAWKKKRKKDIQRFSVICQQHPQIAPLFEELS